MQWTELILRGKIWRKSCLSVRAHMYLIMKKHPLFLVAVATSLLASCSSVSLPSVGNFAGPIEGGYNPLDPPGKRKKAQQVAESGSLYQAGAIVETTHPSSPLFHKVPSGDDQPFAVLNQGVVLEVMETDGSYVRVKSEDGHMGFIPDAMIGPQAVLESTDELVPVDMTLNPDGVPSVAPDPEIPSIEPPVIVDPAAAVSEAPVPTIPSVPATPSAPVIPPEPEFPSLE